MSDGTVSPEEAHDLVEDEDYAYVDVRTPEEFAGGHPEGAYNVPWALRGAGRMAPNAAFLDVMKATFATDAKLVVGCQMGGRSAAATRALRDAGFTGVLDQRAGYGGRKDSFGGMAELGWQGAGLPISIDAEEGRDYASLSAASAGGSD